MPWISSCLILLGGWAAIASGIGRTSWYLSAADASGPTLLLAHWAHLDATHATLNALGWSLAVYLLRERPMLVCALTLAAMVSVSWLWTSHETLAGIPGHAYAGLSSVVYALFAYACLTRPAAQAIVGLSLLLVSAGVGLTASEGAAYEIAHRAHFTGIVTAAVCFALNRALTSQPIFNAPRKSRLPKGTPLARRMS